MFQFPLVLLAVSCAVSFTAFGFWTRGLRAKNRQKLENGRKDFHMDEEHFSGGKPSPHNLEERPKSKAEIFYIIHVSARMVFMFTVPFVFIALALLYIEST